MAQQKEFSEPAVAMQSAEKAFQAGDIAGSLATYRRVMMVYPSSPESADALFATGYLLAYFANQQKDYHQALAVFDEFAMKYPKHVKIAEANNWRAILKAIIECRKENEHLTRSIEQLKKLDMKHEERRTR